MSTLMAHWEPEPTPRRLKLLRISPEILICVFDTDRESFRITGMPRDAKILSVSDQLGLASNEIVFMVESKEFPEVLAGGIIPELILTVERKGCPDTSAVQPTAIVEEATV